MPAEPASSLATTPGARLSEGDAATVRSERASDLRKALASAVETADQQPKQPLMADMIKFPAHVRLKAKELLPDQRLKLAGQLAAEVLKRYPHLIQQLGSTNAPLPPGSSCGPLSSDNWNGTWQMNLYPPYRSVRQMQAMKSPRHEAQRSFAEGPDHHQCGRLEEAKTPYLLAIKADSSLAAPRNNLGCV
jgi:hypothetical protein